MNCWLRLENQNLPLGLAGMGQIIEIQSMRTEKIKLQLLNYEREQCPVVLDTSSGPHAAVRVICHETHVTLIEQSGNCSVFRYGLVFRVSPMYKRKVDQNFGQVVPFRHKI
jgi:hypothetical protein